MESKQVWSVGMRNNSTVDITAPSLRVIKLSCSHKTIITILRQTSLGMKNNNIMERQRLGV